MTSITPYEVQMEMLKDQIERLQHFHFHKAVEEAMGRYFSKHKQISRRERIATAALQGLLANDSLRRVWAASTAARQCVAYADALIAELDKQP